MSTTTPAAAGSPSARTDARKRRKAIVAASLGNGIEYFDWAIYSALATVFATQIFPGEDPIVSLLLTLVTFALGFLARPVGAIVLGNLADTRGRKFVLTLAITITSLGSLAIAFVPTYEVIGVGAPILVLAARLAQGFGAGGEASSAATFLVEAAPARRRAFYGSFQQMSTGAGLLAASLVATAITTLLPDDAVAAYGWRIGFVIAGVLGFVALYIRRTVDDAEIVHDVVRLTSAERRRVRREAFRTHKKRLVQIFFLTVPGTIGNYMFLSYMAGFASTTTGIDIGTALLANSCALAVYCVAIPFAGLLSDRIGRKPQLLIFMAAYILVPYPLFSILGPTFTAVFLANLLGVLVLALFSSVMAAVYNELFPTSIRVAASGVPFALAVSVFGGTAPYVTTQLFALGLSDLIWVYLSVAGVIGLIVTLTLPETGRKEMTE
jgi:MFS transporter, MHS family, alpha-ketoglutarate permease